jgi:hypothetical protein
MIMDIYSFPVKRFLAIFSVLLFAFGTLAMPTIHGAECAGGHDHHHAPDSCAVCLAIHAPVDTAGPSVTVPPPPPPPTFTVVFFAPDDVCFAVFQDAAPVRGPPSAASPA